MSNDRDKPIAGHEYDGIEELDNPLPKWWLATFYGAIVFSIIYWGYYEMGPGPSHDETLARRMAKIEAAYEAHTEAAAEEVAELDVQDLLSDPAALEVGKKHFVEKCTPCHGPNGEGTIGPNLTDKYWIHSKGDMEGIIYSIQTGFPEKGMPPWGPLIPADEQPMVAAYVISLQGTNPPNAKEPQGELVE